jgi:CBS domain containing-hemolysin-like protein
METTKKLNEPLRINTGKIIVFSLVLVILLSAAIKHLLFGWIKSIVDFSMHHYFLMGFALLLTLTVLFMRFSPKPLLQVKQKYRFTARKVRRQKRLHRLFINRLKRLKQKMRHEQKLNTNLNASEHFEDVLREPNLKQKRNNDLRLALMLHEKSQSEVTLTYKHFWLKHKLKTAIWHVNQDNIMLKGGVVLPISAVYKIDF